MKVTSSSRQQYLGLAAAAGLQLVVFLPLALGRLVARDEGFYVLAARLVMEGQELYRDFFFPQMPLVPYLYGIWMKVFGTTWISARLCAAALTILLGLLLFRECWKRFNWLYALVALTLYCTSNFVFPWYLTVQTYSASVLLLFAGYCCVPAKRDSALSDLHCYASGFLVGLAINCRLFFAGVAPVILLYLLLHPAARTRVLRVGGLWLAGAALALLPNIYYLVIDCDAYFFNNLGYHLARSGQSFAEGFQKKSIILLNLLGLRDSVKFDAFQLPLLLYLTVFSLLARAVKRQSIDLAYYLAAALFLLNLLPTPAYMQYFCTLLPFLIIGALYGIEQIVMFQEQHATIRAKSFVLSLLVVLTFFYCRDLHSDLERYTRSGTGVIGIRNEENAAKWTLSRVRDAAAQINALTRSADMVITLWPGYLLEAHARPYPGTENHFGVAAAARLGSSEKTRYHVLALADIRAAIAGGRAALVVLNDSKRRRLIQDALAAGGYTFVSQEPPVKLYKRVKRIARDTIVLRRSR